MKQLQATASKLSKLIDAMPFTDEGVIEAIRLAQDLEVLRKAIFILKRYSDE